GRPLAELARSLASLEPEHVMTALGVDPALRFDFVVCRDLFTRLPALERDALLRLLLALLAPMGALSLAQVIPRLGQRLSSLVRMDNSAIAKRLETAEERAYSDPSNDLVNWSHGDLAGACRSAGARQASAEVEPMIEVRRITERELELWLASDST